MPQKVYLPTGVRVRLPVRDLMYQWHRRIWHGLGCDAGIIGDNLFRVEPVSVTTYDSAWIHMERLGAKFALIVFDECHHLPGEVRRDAARMSAAPLRLGLTATPERADGRHADEIMAHVNEKCCSAGICPLDGERLPRRLTERPTASGARPRPEAPTAWRSTHESP